MSRPVESIDETATLTHAYERMKRTRISALAVLDSQGRAMGVVTRTDLLRHGRQARSPSATLAFDGRQVRDAFSRGVLTVSADASVADAARHLLDRKIHRVFVENAGRVVGVLSGRDIIEAVAENELPTKLSSIMRAPLRIVHARAPLGDTVDRLLLEGISSLVVLEGDRAVGIFSRFDALRSGHLSPGVAVGDAMGLSLLELPASTPIGKAAARAIQEGVRHILVREDGTTAHTVTSLAPAPVPRGVVGIVTSTDLAGAALLAR